MTYSNAESYIAIAMLTVIGTAVFAEPDKSKFQKWLYWCIAPALAFVALVFAFKSIVGGLGAGRIVACYLGGGYLRYKL